MKEEQKVIRKHWKRTLVVLAASAVSSGTASAQILGGNLGGGVSGTAGGAVKSGTNGAIQGAANAALNGGTGQQVLQQGLNGAVGGAVNGAVRNSDGVGANANGAVRSAAGGSASLAGQALNLGAATRVDANGNLSTDFANQLRSRFTTSTRIVGDGPVELSERLPQELRQMGFRPGDVLLNANGQPLRSLGDVKSWVQSNGKLNVLRGDENMTLNLAADTSTSATAGPAASASGDASANIAADVGLATKSTTEGVVITDVTSNSLAAQAGLKAGDQVVSVDGQAIANQQTLNQALARAENAATVEYLRGETRARANVAVGSLSARSQGSASASSGNAGWTPATTSASAEAEAQQRSQVDLEQRVAELERIVAQLRSASSK